ncbi:MAG: MgtC/SapB family protein [Clostridium sp.]|nr:MgtC/SapB family protein [Clostridium sp.]
MNSNIDYILRLLVAGLCGILIGYERESRMKEAGIRTHFIVALGASLIMIVSKYGFNDEINIQNISIDPSRIAAQIVSGIGFLGAGMIVMHKQTVKGLTTAAGIWATAGVGMCIGAGLYFIGLISAFIIVAAQTIFHSKFNWLASPNNKNLTVEIINDPKAIDYIKNCLKKEDIIVISLKASSNNYDLKHISLQLKIKLPLHYNTIDLINILQNNSFVKSIQI